MKTLYNFSINEKNILLRVDLNVPINNGVITDDTKIIDIKSTVKKLQTNKNKIFLLTHLGRPGGRFNKRFSTRILINKLKKILSQNEIFFSKSFNKNEIDALKKTMKPSGVCLLENIRFYREEENNSIDFAKSLAKNFDVYVNDAFSASHRKHASIVGITKYLPSIAGFKLVNEIENLNNFLQNPKKPMTAIIGGSKISTKLKLLDNLIETFDNIIIGGAMANTFLLSQDFNIGKSLVEKNLLNEAKDILKKSNQHNTNLILPIDVVCSKQINNSNEIKFFNINNIPSDQIALDIGHKTLKLIRSVVIKSKMVLWNGPLGVFEYKPFDIGTNAVVEILKKDAKKFNITTFVGGGDTLAAIKNTNAKKYFSYISTAGGAFLEWLEGKESPGVISLRKNNLS